MVNAYFNKCVSSVSSKCRSGVGWAFKQSKAISEFEAHGGIWAGLWPRPKYQNCHPLHGSNLIFVQPLLADGLESHKNNGF